MTPGDAVARKSSRIVELHGFSPRRTALIVVDMQRGFLEPGAALEVPAARSIIPNVRALLEAARSGGLPVIFTRFVYSQALPSLRGDPFGPEHLPPIPEGPTGFGLPSGNCLLGIEGPNSPDIIEELAPLPSELVVDGYSYDKFYGTCLDQALRARDIRFLTIAGILTEICVNATLMSAASREYRVTAVGDAVQALRPELQEACFEIWERKFARILSTKDVVSEIGRLSPEGKAS